MEVTLLAQYPHEAKTIAHWYYNEWACHVPNVSQAMVLKDVRKKSINNNKIPLAFIAREADELVGVAEIKVRENPNYPEYKYWLAGVFVPPSARGLGISSLLIKNAVIKAKELGVLKLFLQCETHNIKLYQKHGFQVLHLADKYDQSLMIMQCELTS
jgi:putative hydrolase of the HAD superfamily